MVPYGSIWTCADTSIVNSLISCQVTGQCRTALTHDVTDDHSAHVHHQTSRRQSAKAEAKNTTSSGTAPAFASFACATRRRSRRPLLISSSNCCARPPDPSSCASRVSWRLATIPRGHSSSRASRMSHQPLRLPAWPDNRPQHPHGCYFVRQGTVFRRSLVRDADWAGRARRGSMRQSPGSNQKVVCSLEIVLPADIYLGGD
jgi:hypothetical protein